MRRPQPMAAHLSLLALGLVALAEPDDGVVEAGSGGVGSGETCASGVGARGCREAGGGSAPLWPRARGHLGSYGVVNLTGPWDLSKPSLVWHPGETKFRDVVLGGPLIDGEGSFYVTSAKGIHKVSSGGQLLWRFRMGATMAQAGSLSPDGSRLYNVDQANNVFALDTATGAPVWTRAYGRGLAGDTAYVENHDGVLIYQGNCRVEDCQGSDTVYALRVEDGGLLWSFHPDNPTWNLMAMFPQDGTVVFQDYDSVTYRLGLHNGSLLWKAGGGRSRGGRQTWTDGGCILGGNGVVYAVSSKAHALDHHPLSGGGVHAYRLSDGELLWERHFQRPVFTWPVVGRLASRSDTSVVVAVGANGYFPWNAVAASTLRLVPLGAQLGLAWSLCRCCRGGCKHLAKRVILGCLAGLLGAVVLVLLFLGGAFVPIGTFQGEVYALDAETGAQQWVYSLPHWNHRYSAGDWEGLFERTRHAPERTMCLPAAYNSPTIDAAGVVYIGFMDGAMYALKDANGDGVVQGDEEVSRVDLEGAFLHSGAAIVPGLMAVTNCNELFVWKT